MSTKSLTPFLLNDPMSCSLRGREPTLPLPPRTAITPSCIFPAAFNPAFFPAAAVQRPRVSSVTVHEACSKAAGRLNCRREAVR